MRARTPLGNVATRVARAVGRVFVGLSLLVVLTLSLALSSTALPGVRALIAARVNALLASELRGTITIEHIGAIGIFGASGLRVRGRDPDGHPVFLVDGVTAKVDPVRLVRSLVGRGPLDVAITQVRVDSADISLDATSDGALYLAEMVTPRAPAPEKPTSKRSGASSGLRLGIADATVKHAWVHGRPPGAPSLDVDIRDIDTALEVTPGRVTATLVRASIRSRGMVEGADPRGGIRGRLEMADGEGPIFGGGFDGDVGGVQTSLSAAYDGQKIDAKADAAASGAERRLAAEVPLRAPFTMHLNVSGPLRKLAIRARGTVGASPFEIEGGGELDATPSARATLRIAHVDLRDFVDDGPASDVGAQAEASFVGGSGTARAEFHAVIEPGRIGTRSTPEVIADGSLNGTDLDADVRATERDANATASVQLRAAPGGPLLVVNAEAHVQDLARLLRSAGVTRGYGHVAIEGTLNLDTRWVEGHLRARGNDVASSSVALQTIAIESEVKGPLTRPRIDATASGQNLMAAPFEFRSVQATIAGTFPRAVATAALRGDDVSVSANACVELGGAVVLSDVHGAVERGGVAATADAHRIRVAPGGLSVERAVVNGLGDPISADLSLSTIRSNVSLRSSRVDLARVMAIAGRRSSRFRGSVAADVNVVARRAGATGHARVDLTDVRLDDGANGEGHLDATVAGRHVAGSFRGSWAGSDFDVETNDLWLGGAPTELASWKRAYGRAAVSANVDLARVHAIVPDVLDPFEELSGRLMASIDVSRRGPGEAPEGTVSLRTDRLLVSRKGPPERNSDGTRVRGPEQWRLEGIDVDLDAATSRDKDEATLVARLHDSHGTIAALDAHTRLPSIRVLTDRAAALAFVEQSPTQVHVSVPKRNLADFPPALGHTALDGSVAVAVDATGTLLDPRVTLDLELDDVKAKRRNRARPIDLRLSTKYDGSEAKLDAAVTAAGSRALTLTASGHVAVADLLANRAARPWDASAQAEFTDLPMDAIPELAEESVSGRVSGHADLSLGSGAPPALHADLGVDDLAVGRFSNNRATVKADADAHTLTGRVRMDEPQGSIAADVSLRALWPAALAGSGAAASPDVPTRIDMVARNFRLVPLRPLVRTVVSHLDGRVDADVRFDSSRRGATDGMKGYLRLKDGVFEAPSFGEEVHNVALDATFSPSGIAVNDVYARGTTGIVTGKATVTLDDQGSVKARGQFRIPAKEPIPIAVEGQVLADAWGTLDVEAARVAQTGALTVNVDVPSGGVRLPDKSTHSLQPLEPAEGVRIGVRRGPAEFEVLHTSPIVVADSTDATSAIVKVHLRDVEVRRGTDLRVRLSGDPVAKTGRDAGVTGTITLHEGGYLEVQGKRFEIEHGTITFDGPADNPEVVVTAGWTAPEGSRVFADFVGPLKTGKVTLRSDPAHTKNEILSLILFGTTSGSSAPMAPGTTSGDATAQSAAGLGGGLAAEGLNRALDSVTGLDITARVDTSDSTNPQPELELRIAPDISVSIAHVLGVPPPGANPDYNFATLDWRFRRNWSIETKVGDAGTSMLDLVWQYRY